MASPYLRPHWLLWRVANPLVGLLGIAPRLAVRGRRSGKRRTVPINVLEHDGERYLVAPRGETEWVRNLRAAGRAELRSPWRREPVTAVEVPVEERQSIIDAYRARWDLAVRAQFEALPDAADHPVFRLERATEAG